MTLHGCSSISGGFSAVNYKANWTKPFSGSFLASSSHRFPAKFASSRIRCSLGPHKEQRSFSFQVPFGTTPTAKDTSKFANTRVDWKETKEAHAYKVYVPGLTKGEVKIEVEENRVLRICVEGSGEKEYKDDKRHHIERTRGKFLNSFQLPENAKVDEVKAGIQNGVLTVTIPKKKPEVKSIDING